MKDDDIQRTNQANTRRKRSPCAPNRGRTYDLPIRTSEALPLSCKRLVIGERGLNFEINCDVTLAESVMKFDLSSHNFAISNVDLRYVSNAYCESSSSSFVTGSEKEFIEVDEARSTCEVTSS